MDVVVAWRILTRQGDGNSELEFLSMGLEVGFFYGDGRDGEDGVFYGMDGGDGFRLTPE